MFYKIVLECRKGPQNVREFTAYVKGKNLESALRKARKLAGGCRQRTLSMVKLLKEITREEYLRGRRELRGSMNAYPV